MRTRFVLGIVLVLAASVASAQQTQSADPLQCWWRTSNGAIRAGEPFTVVLTCAVVENDAVQVVVDQSRLEPSVMQFAPFEVLGGSHGADLRSDQRRFFQYEYRLRLIAENQFGRDVSLPETKLSYKVQTRVADKTALQGRDQAYILPALAIRVLSLVPAEATDIRDSGTETFNDVDQRAFRANLFTVIGGVLFAIAGLLGLLAIVRLVAKYRKPVETTERLVSDAAVLRAAGRDLAAVRREREGGGWTPELAGRALAALRVAGTYALGRTAAHMPAAAESSAASRESPAGEHREAGRVVIQTGWPRARRVVASGSITPASVARERARATSAKRGQVYEALEQALTSLTAAQYGRNGTLDDTALDEALATGSQVLRRAKYEQSWMMRKMAARRIARQGDTRAWSR